MDDVDEDLDIDSGAPHLGLDRTQLLGLAVDEHDPAASVLGVATLSLLERLADGLAGLSS